MSAYSLIFLQFAALMAIWWVLIQMKKDKAKRAQEAAQAVDDEKWREFLASTGLAKEEDE